MYQAPLSAIRDLTLHEGGERTPTDSIVRRGFASVEDAAGQEFPVYSQMPRCAAGYKVAKETVSKTSHRQADPSGIADPR